MPQLANQTVTGPGAVAHTFKPRGITGGVATLVESTGVPVADKELTVSAARTPNGAVKFTLKLMLPQVQDVEVGGITQPTAVRKAYGTVTLSADPRSTAAERLELLEMTLSAVGAADNVKLFKDLEYFW